MTFHSWHNRLCFLWAVTSFCIWVGAASGQEKAGPTAAIHQQVPTLAELKVAGALRSSYRTRQLRPGLFVSERTWFPHEKPAHLYAKAWCFVGFADSEEQAQTLCKRCEKQLQQRKPVFTRSTHTQKGPKAQHDLLNTYRGK